MTPGHAGGVGCVVEKKSGSDSIRPFQLVKFFTYSSLVVILACTFLLSWAISLRANKLLLKRSEAYAQVFSENLNHQVYQQFVLPMVLRYRSIALSNPKQFELLDTIVQNVTHGLKIDSVTIFDAKENVISYSTVPENVGKRDVGGVEYQKALLGEHVSVFALNGGMLSLLPGREGISGRLRTYIPFRQERPLGQNTGSIMGVIEIVQDLSDELEANIRFQVTIMGISFLIMGILFAVLQFIVARADRIIAVRARETRDLEDKLHDAERLAALGKMVAAVSHEIKNPLGIVRSTAEILGKRVGKIAPETGHLANIIIEETTRLDGIVREFLDFARPQTPKLAPCQVNGVLLKGVQFMEAEFAKHNIAVSTAFDETLPEVRADEGLLYRAFLNIMVNAVQAMPEGGPLSVTTRRAHRHDRIVVAIADAGVGIRSDKLSLIFTPFYTDKIRGTGLGLAIVKNIVSSHDGTITVMSQEGKGTTIRVELPI